MAWCSGKAPLAVTRLLKLDPSLQESPASLSRWGTLSSGWIELGVSESFREGWESFRRMRVGTYFGTAPPKPPRTLDLEIIKCSEHISSPSMPPLLCGSFYFSSSSPELYT